VLVQPIPVAVQSKTRMVLVRWTTRIMGLNYTRGMYTCSAFCCPVYEETLRWTYSPVQGVLPKCLAEFIVSEVNSELEQARGPKIRKMCNNLFGSVFLGPNIFFSILFCIHLHLVPRLMSGAIPPYSQYVFMTWC